MGENSIVSFVSFCKTMCQNDEVATISFFISNNVENSDVRN